MGVRKWNCDCACLESFVENGKDYGFIHLRFSIMLTPTTVTIILVADLHATLDPVNNNYF